MDEHTEQNPLDIVKVVRCKDCWYSGNGCCMQGKYYDGYDEYEYRPDFFCADGLRKEDVH